MHRCDASETRRRHFHRDPEEPWDGGCHLLDSDFSFLQIISKTASQNEKKLANRERNRMIYQLDCDLYFPDANYQSAQ